MAAPRPFFGFACTQEELEYRNRITVKFGINTMESWVGRDTRRYIPGLYWWTLLPASLAEQHGIPLSILVRASQEHIELEGQQHLLRFYDKSGGLAIGGRHGGIVPLVSRAYLTSRSCGQNFKE